MDRKPRFRCARCERAIRGHPRAMEGAPFHPACALAHLRDLDRIERLEIRAAHDRAWREFTSIHDATES